MELYQLRGFVTVADLGNVTRAAERLHVSQPALSAQIKALEEDLGIELFERGHGGMALTPAGQRLLEHSRQLLAAAQALRQQALALQGKVAGTARLGTVSDPAFIRLGELMAAALEHFPLVHIELHHEVSGTAFEKVAAGLLDGSFYYGDLSHPAVHALELRQMHYVIVGPAAWAARLHGQPFSEVAAQPWISTPAISTHHQLVSGLFRRHRCQPAEVVEVDDERLVASLVDAGLGVALMREDLALAGRDAGTLCLWDGARLGTRLKFLYLAEREGDPVVDALLQLLRALWHGAGTAAPS